MPTIDTRHSEMNHLFSLYLANYLGNAELQIAQQESSMEQADVEVVVRKFEEWKQKQEVKKNAEQCGNS